MKKNVKGEAVVLGMLKKEKSSKPFFVFLVIGLIIAMLWFMPQIQDYFKNGDGPVPEFYRTTILKFINGDDYEVEDTEEAEGEVELVLLSNETVLNRRILTLSNISLADGKIKYTISSKANIDLENNSFNIEVYNENKAFLGRVILNGKASTTPEEKTQDVNFKTISKAYYVRLLN